MSQRTVEQPELKDLPCTGVFFNNRHFLCSHILSSAAESTPKQRVSISSQPTTNKNAAHMMSKHRDEGLLSELQD